MILRFLVKKLGLVAVSCRQNDRSCPDQHLQQNEWKERQFGLFVAKETIGDPKVDSSGIHTPQHQLERIENSLACRHKTHICKVDQFIEGKEEYDGERSQHKEDLMVDHNLKEASDKQTWLRVCNIEQLLFKFYTHLLLDCHF